MDPRDVVTVPEADGDDVGAPARLGHFTLGRQLGEGGMGVVFEAYDTRLDRRVALKLLRPGRGGSIARARLVREAQALAKLSHPNVVTVYEVTNTDEVVYVAMELVDGTTLREWIEVRRPWHEVVAVVLAAGRGLAAVHALGLVHRDFKPANVLIDDHGRVKVGDFGLVGLIDDGGGVARPVALEGADLTATGSSMGTPAYMAPEQRRDATAVDARADQYSFAVSLVEALSGKIYPGEGALDAVPPAIRSIVGRALAEDPGGRYPAMEPLLDALGKTLRSSRTWWIGGGAAAVAVVSLGLIAWRASTPATVAAPIDPCPPPEARIATMWGEARQRTVRAHVAATDPALGEQRATAIGRVVDPFVASWRDMHAASCRATRVDATQSDSLFDLRARCLERRAAELVASVDVVLASDDAEAIDGAIGGLIQVTPVARCADTDALARADDLPAAPEARAAVDALVLEIQTLEVERRADRLADLGPRLIEAVARAREVDHPRTLAAALVVLAKVQLMVGESDAGEATLRELTQVAARAHDDEAEAFAWTKLITVIGFDRGLPAEALAIVPAASAAVLRAGDPPHLRADLMVSEAGILIETPRVADGIAALLDARKLQIAAGASNASSPSSEMLVDILLELANAYARTGELELAIASYREAIATWREILGPDTSDEAIALHNLSQALDDAGRYDEALVAARDAVRINEARTGVSPRVASNLASVAEILSNQGDYTGALAAYDRSLEILRTTAPDDALQQTPGLIGRASMLAKLERNDDALATYDTLFALIERTGATTGNYPAGLNNRGELHSKLDRCDLAIPDYQRAAAEFEAQRGAETYMLLYPLVGLGRCLVVTGHAADALVPLERAVTFEARGGDALQVARARAWLGRALVESRRDRPRGLALAREARAAMAGAAAADPDTAEAIRDLDAWLAGHK